VCCYSGWKERAKRCRRQFLILFGEQENRQSRRVRLIPNSGISSAESSIGRSTNSDRFHGEIDGETTFLYAIAKHGGVSLLMVVGQRIRPSSKTLPHLRNLLPNSQHLPQLRG
jgi:hypothetical protein